MKNEQPPGKKPEMLLWYIRLSSLLAIASTYLYFLIRSDFIRFALENLTFSRYLTLVVGPLLAVAGYQFAFLIYMRTSHSYSPQSQEKITLNRVIGALFFPLYSVGLGCNWLMVAVFSKLPILSRVSYTAVVVVPIIAGLWPVFANAIVWYNTSLLSSIVNDGNRLIVSIETLEERLTSEFGNRGNEVLRDRTEHVTDFLDRQIQKVRNAEVANIYLPPTWVYMFFAALLVILSMTLYEASCPSIVKNYTMDRYVMERKADYSSSPTNLEITESARDVDQFYEWYVTQSDYLRVLYQIQFEAIQPWYRKFRLPKINSSFTSEVENSELTKIERVELIALAAKLKYVRCCRENHFMSIVCLVLYVLAITLVFAVIAVQVRAVLFAAGML